MTINQNKTKKNLTTTKKLIKASEIKTKNRTKKFNLENKNKMVE